MDLPWTPEEEDTAFRLSDAEFAELFGGGADAGLEEPLRDQATPGAPSGARAEVDEARVARQRRVALRRDRAAPPSREGEAAEAAEATGAETTAERRAAELEKELRSAAMRNSFLTRENSKLSLRLEAAEARTVTLERENARLRRARDLALVDGAGI